MAQRSAGLLPDSAYQECNRLLKRCELARKDAELAIAAKQPMEGHLQLLLDMCDELKSIKSALWPDRP
jgi:hypothetical protein